MKRYVEVESLKNCIQDQADKLRTLKDHPEHPEHPVTRGYLLAIKHVKEDFDYVPSADVVEVETLKAWLYKMAINNVGCFIEGDFSTAIEEIISRLDGLRLFARERKDQ